MLGANAVKDDATFLSPTLAMRVTGRAGGITAHGAHLLECPSGLIETMLALDDQRIGERQVSVEKDLLVGLEFENQIDELLLLIDVEHGKHEMLEIPKVVPPNIAIIEGVRRHLRSDGSCHMLCPQS